MNRSYLLISDLHEKVDLLKRLDNFLSKNKLTGVICAGDLTNRSYTALGYANNFYSIIKKYKLKLFYIHGNNEPEEVKKFFEKNNSSVHLRVRKINDSKIIGIGGFLDEWHPELSRYLKNSILVTHYPVNPSKANFKNAPAIHISGHVHSRESLKLINNTLFVSLKSAGFFHRGGILILPEKKIKFVSI